MSSIYEYLNRPEHAAVEAASQGLFPDDLTKKMKCVDCGEMSMAIGMSYTLPSGLADPTTGPHCGCRMRTPAPEGQTIAEALDLPEEVVPVEPAGRVRRCAGCEHRGSDGYPGPNPVCMHPDAPKPAYLIHCDEYGLYSDDCPMPPKGDTDA